jgi:hypothetical protein
MTSAGGRVTAGMPVQPLDTIELMSVPNTTLHHTEIPSPPFRLWPLARRLMTEARDRVLPILFKSKDLRRSSNAIPDSN